ncbi:Endonuclease/exonuclease/phosphatase superfamily [Sesbania bispinosa]|nr:Endonuclease/exonuclease/phosphatase superfamily [Sesbania bispinosa]
MMVSSTRVSQEPNGEANKDGDLSAQEKDLLDRSKKKPKVAVSVDDPYSGTMVAETQLTQQVLRKAQIQGSRFSILEGDCVLGNMEEQVIVQKESFMRREEERTWQDKLSLSTLNKGKSAAFQKGNKDIGSLKSTHKVSIKGGVNSGNVSKQGANHGEGSSHVQVAADVMGLDARNKNDVTHTSAPLNPSQGMAQAGVKEVMNPKSVDETSLIGPEKHPKIKMGLNLKSQVKFKNIKQVSRCVGAQYNVPMPLMCEALNLDPPSGLKIDVPSIVGPKGDVEVCNRRPPDSSNILDGFGVSNVTGKVIKDHPQYVHLRIIPKDTSPTWLLTCIYASPRPNVREDLWANLSHIAGDTPEGQLAIEDFNSHLSVDEKSGGAPPIARSMNRFREVLQYCGLIDLGYVGPPFTWEWRGVKERLDRGIRDFKTRSPRCKRDSLTSEVQGPYVSEMREEEISTKRKKFKPENDIPSQDEISSSS